MKIPPVLVPLLMAALLCLSGLTSSAWAQEAPPPVSWDELKERYANYGKSPMVTEVAQTDAEFRLSHISFANAKGDTVTGLLLLPKKEGRYPVALLLHGYNSDKESMVKFFGRPLATKGIACLALDAFQHGERKKESGDGSGGSAFLAILRNTIPDWRQAIDYLSTRKDMDLKRLSVFGYSMGSMMGSILSAVDERIKAAAFCVGGDFTAPMVSKVPPAVRLDVAAASPSLFISHISPRPVLLLNALNDKTIAKEMAQRLQDAAKEPKTILWVDGGHIISPTDAEKARAWLISYLLNTTSK
jgi:dienelactone hydrolase